MRVLLDKIASATQNAKVPREAVLSPVIPAVEGTVVAARVRGTKTVYNSVEDLYGRMIRLDEGDIIAGVLGSRRALRGYAGVVPEKIAPGDRLDILNLGGVIGKCTSTNLELGPPLQAEILGSVLSFPFLGERHGVPANIRTGAVAWARTLAPSAPIIYISGTCMQAGKTFACGEIIRYLTRQGRRVCGAKLTGVSLLRDTLSMRDRGAVRCLSFNDLGIVSTNEEIAVPVAKGIINELNREEPDALVIELGDGVLGKYGVQAILRDRELMDAAAMHVLCATDPVAAWGAAKLFAEEFKRELGVISGPATDNAVGKDQIEADIGVRAFNARLEYERLGAHIEAAVFGRTPAAAEGDAVCA